ncbi:nicotinate-nucleotide adenylyltransferase [Sneathiella litorea]|uniref:Probable nicotinate-nucleotide adenylyltransferase n=1 Tax=Sneathiella litorea TaxID=2606216 RepID=A0A6L8W344_9PROT|nr:nicotinate-nucleotide adenylyltransferase [Sneathiella litorea]MZR29418.1 nicotinate-nucleotide adenylyltransferase [Sneathiella litorea]
MRAQKIGLLGGSFNPAHDGHRQISLAALRLLDLDQIWWLVSPQNPLKSAEGMAEYEERLAAAEKIAHHSRIRVSDFEARIGEQRTVRTLAALKVTFPQHRFVWLMGADNMVQLPKWQHWERIMELVPVAIFNRPGYTYKALNGKVAYKYRNQRVLNGLTGDHRRQLADIPPPAWTFLTETTIKLSSTQIRNYHDTTGNTCS